MGKVNICVFSKVIDFCESFSPASHIVKTLSYAGD